MTSSPTPPVHFDAVSRPGPGLVAALEALFPPAAGCVFQLANADGPGPVLEPRPGLWGEFVADPGHDTLVVHPLGDEYRVLSVKRLAAPNNPTNGLLYLSGEDAGQAVDPHRWARRMRAFAQHEDLVYSRLETASLTPLNSAMMARHRPPPFGMPRTHGREPGKPYTDFRVPSRIGWSNTWSDPLVRALGLTMALRAGTLPAARVERLPHGWWVQVTEDPTDVERAEHQDALRALYEAAPCVGFRRSPCW